MCVGAVVRVSGGQHAGGRSEQGAGIWLLSFNSCGKLEPSSRTREEAEQLPTVYLWVLWQPETGHHSNPILNQKHILQQTVNENRKGIRAGAPKARGTQSPG